MVSRDRATGDRATGDRATGDRVTGERVTGDRVIGDRATGDRATGDRVTGDEPGVGSGDDVLDWLRSVDARRLVRRRLRAAGLPASPDHVADVLGDATVSVWRRMRRPEPLVVDTPAAYGATVVRNVVVKTVRGRDLLVDEEDMAVLLQPSRTRGGSGIQGGPRPSPMAVIPAVDSDAGEPYFEDDVRMAIEHLGGRAWLSSATLALLTFLLVEADPPVGAPAPVSGSTPEQAACWPALWLAGQLDVFPDRALGSGGDRPARRRTRARRISAVRSQLERAYAHLGSTVRHGGPSDG